MGIKDSKAKTEINKLDYQKQNSVSERTATRDLSNLVEIGILEQIGVTGKGTKYIIKTP
ncbi:MAG: hypothetical protein K8H86_13895 [Ignavibacteriaceae bacterium]|nr:hypothetical protein [Ignavibacteriaceae bacterium]